MRTHSMRPKYKEDVSFIPTSDGVYLRGNIGRLMLKGKSLYTLLKHLVPHLNGNVTLEELTAGLDNEKKRMVIHLIEKLCAHDFVKDTSQDQSHTLRPAEMEAYAPTIAFLDSLRPSALHLFETFRHLRLLLIGDEADVPSLVQAGLQCGVRQLGVIAVPESEERAALHEVPAERIARCDDEQVVQWMRSPCWEREADVRLAIEDCDAIVHLAGPSALPRARVLNRLCLEERRILVQSCVLDHQAWIGPLVGPETGNCWECAWWRVQANRGGLAQAERPLAEAEAALIAQRLLFALFQYCTRTCSDETTGRVSVLDLVTWQSESHRFLPHPRCAACRRPDMLTAARFLAQVQQVQQHTPLEPQTFVRDIAECIDERCGLFTALDATPFVQIPLAVSAVRLADPFPAPGRSASLEVLATGIGPQEARERVLFKACEQYAAHALSQRGLFSTEVALDHGSPLIAPERVPGADPATPERQVWTWALDLQTQQASLVPTLSLWPERGVAAGTSWAEALCQALLDWCVYLTLERLGDAQRPYARLDLATMAVTPRGAYLSRLLTSAGVRVTIYDVTGSLQVPTFAVCLGEQVVAYIAHCEVGQALDLALERALQHYQSAHFRQAAYALAPVADCPARLRGEQLCLPAYPVPETWAARQDWLLEHLQRNGWCACAIPLDADPALTRALPFLVRVLVYRAEEHRGEGRV